MLVRERQSRGLRDGTGDQRGCLARGAACGLVPEPWIENMQVDERPSGDVVGSVYERVQRLLGFHVQGGRQQPQADGILMD
jgi:hypothetical protein